MSNLAHAYLKDRAPQLLEHELGFQLLEKNEDNDRAVGVFGFKVGNQLLYAPVFFLNGELKGHQLLYMKEADTFVPMKENWINYILNRKPNVLGEEVQTDLRGLGVDRPNMDGFRESPVGKYAAAQPDWLVSGLPGLLDAIGNYPRPELQVPQLVEKSAEMATRFLQIIDAYPQLAKPIVQCYGKDIVETAIETAKTACSVAPKEVKRKKKKRVTGSVLKRSSDPAPQDLQIWIDDGTARCREGLTEKQSEQLKRDGIYIADERSEASTAFTVQAPMALQNPDDTGLYDVLCKPDSFEKCLYIHGPHGRRGQKHNGVLVRIGDGDTKAWTETHPSEIFAIEHYSGEDYKEWYDSLPKADSLEVGAHYVLLAPNGQGTCVFEVESTLPAEGGEKCYKIWWKGAWGDNRPARMPEIHDRRYELDYEETTNQIVLNRLKGNRFRSRTCDLLAPSDTKVVRIKGPPKLKRHAPEEGCSPPPCTSPDCGESGESSDPPALRPGNHVDLQLGILKMSTELRIFSDGIEAIVDGQRSTPKAAMVRLVRDYGLREKTARELLKRANLRRGIKCRIKLAQPYGPYGALGNAPTAPMIPDQEFATDSFMGSGLPMVEPNEMEMPVEGLEGLATEPDMAAPPEPMIAQQLMQASQTGQKEVLDTSLMSNLLRGSQNETLIDSHLSNLMKGLDSLGRLIFNMYWHRDKFEDRYGANNLTELEDAMINSYENLGDVTLELKQKAVEPYPDEGVDIALGEGEQ
jgi:hypothetical protein